jgi:hypothetical protein
MLIYLLSLRGGKGFPVSKPTLLIGISLILICGIPTGFRGVSGHSRAQALEAADPAAASFLEPDPPSTILPAGKSTLGLTVRSAQPTDCRYSLGPLLPYELMTPFSSGQGTVVHNVTLKGLDTDPSRINYVYVRCAAKPAELLYLRYRCLPRANPKFPRTGNLWGSWRFKEKGMAYCARIDLWLGADFSPSEIVQLRALNPDILVLKSMNTVENVNLPDSYYLKDIHGRRIEVWPATFRLNLTKTVVAEYQARYAYQCMLDSELMVDGCFFDNFFTSQSWLTHDIYGHRVRIDADEDGKEDDPKWLDAAWRRGVFHELRTWRHWMPYAVASGHLPLATEPDVADIFNGDSIGFTTADVLDGRTAFTDAWKEYNDWARLGRTPHIVMIESAPPDQIAYGYGYDPVHNIPASTLEFARTYYPYVRFGLMLTLMNNGYFAHEFGDIDHGQDWWYDELDFDLGIPLSPARRVPSADSSPNPNLIENGGFEKPLDGTWFLLVYEADGTKATAQRDFQEKADGTASARITVKSLGQGVDWHVTFEQRDRSLQKGQVYALSFMARADRPNRTIRLYSQQAPPGSRGCGRRFALEQVGKNIKSCSKRSRQSPTPGSSFSWACREETSGWTTSASSGPPMISIGAISLMASSSSTGRSAGRPCRLEESLSGSKGFRHPAIRAS